MTEAIADRCEVVGSDFFGSVLKLVFMGLAHSDG
jgi:hypothetical protein